MSRRHVTLTRSRPVRTQKEVMTVLRLVPMLFALLVGCDRGPGHDCSNRECVCPEGRDCELSCHAPPCNVTCEESSRCEAECANGTCACQRGASCAFLCTAPPCHVRCAGDNERCDGTCANGSCVCGQASSCEFVCESGPCHSECPEGASCVVRCPNAPAGTQDCDITRCWAGPPLLCPDGRATTCNAACPAPEPDAATSR